MLSAFSPIPMPGCAPPLLLLTVCLCIPRPGYQETMKGKALVATAITTRRFPLAPGPERGQISVDVDLVVLEATVLATAANFHLVSDLREQNSLKYHEDGVRQSIKVFQREDNRVTVGLIVDHSGSMGQKLAEVTVAATTFARASNPVDQMFVVNFNERVTHGLPEGLALTNRADLLQQAIGATAASGQTALYDAVVEGLQLANGGGPQKKVLIVISDGGDNASTLRLNDVLKQAARGSTLIYTVGIFDSEDPDRNPQVLRRLADATGGEAFFPGTLHDVGPVCERIARDIRNQYTIGYVSRELGCTRRLSGGSTWSLSAQAAGDSLFALAQATANEVLAPCRRNWPSAAPSAWFCLKRKGLRQTESLSAGAGQSATPAAVAISLADNGGIVGRMEIPRLGISTIVMEGTTASTLRHALGHISGTPLPGSPGNVGVSGHRDTFFRPLRHIETNDVIALTTTVGTYRYRVLNTEIVNPDNVAVLNPTSGEALTLVTCYPFYYLGPAPQRFIVHGQRIP